MNTETLMQSLKNDIAEQRALARSIPIHRERGEDRLADAEAIQFARIQNRLNETFAKLKEFIW